ncbi:MAG: carboxypeptidase regulatory-like domain-containing protein [Bacteroidota bacterium]
MIRTLLTFFYLIATLSLLAQGSTAAIITGKITDNTTLSPLPAASIKAIHQPSGTEYRTNCDQEGNYWLSGLRVGGPYRLVISNPGAKDTEIEEIYLDLGQRFVMDVAVQQTTFRLAAFEAKKLTNVTSNGQTGPATTLHASELVSLPSLDRNLEDYVRLSPWATLNPSGNFSFLGTNNRYNGIYVDGIISNDVFGLSGTGTNGGQTGAASISIDAIEQLQIITNPYDLTLGGFAGGSVNAITKSGTNNLEGTAYYYSRSEELAGSTNETLLLRDGGESTDLSPFNNRLYGMSLGGALKKNKIFFYLNAELQRDQAPTSFDLDNYLGTSNSGDLNGLRDFVRNTYNYDPGDFQGQTDELEALRLFGKLNFNLNDKNQLSLRHLYTRIEQFDINSNSERVIHFNNNGAFIQSNTNSFVAELHTTGNRRANNLIIGYSRVVDDRDPIGGDFPAITLFDNGGRINFGSDQFSTANLLEQRLWTLTDQLTFYGKKHSFTLGMHHEYGQFDNLSIRQNFGAYEYGSVDQFLLGSNADAYFRSYSLVNQKIGDEQGATAALSYLQLGFFVQDEWLASDRLTITAGLRLDAPTLLDDPAIAPGFNDETLTLLQDQYEIGGVQGGVMPETQLLFSPRLGFEYRARKGTIFRGGAGIFTGRIPFIWPAGAFSNNGLSIGGIFRIDQSFEPLVTEQPTDPNFSTPFGQVDLFTSDFKFPQLFRSSLAIEKALPGGLTATIEGVYSKNINDILYTNINSDPTQAFAWTGGPDNRPIYTNTSLDPTYTAIYVASNTNEGDAYQLSLSLQKELLFGLEGFLAYSYGDATSLVDGSSSQNSSQWRGNYNVAGRNTPFAGRSEFAPGGRLIAALNYTCNWNKKKNIATQVTLFYEGRAGLPYSYVYGGSQARNINQETGNTTNNRSLIWIPASASEINLIDTDELTAEEQWLLLDLFIEQDEYLSENRGSYAEKNAARTPFFSQFDLRFSQSFGIKSGRKTNCLEISLDIFNFANLLNAEWGLVYDNPFADRLINFVGYEADGTTPQFTFTDVRIGEERFQINDLTSRWRGRFGVRYTFN